MKFLSRIRLRRRRIQNPNSSPIDEPNVETDTHAELTGNRNRHMEDDQVAEESSSSRQHHAQTHHEPPEINSDSVNQTTTTTSTTSVVTVRERNSTVDGPPMDDCCPICFGSFVAPCRAPCGHWYCGGCILEYWNHVAAFRPCKCPMCSRQITKLTPEPSLYQQENLEVSAVLKNVQQYNRLFVGGIYGFILKVLQFPLLMKKVLQAMMDPDRPAAYLGRLRLFALFLGTLYTLSPFDFLPTGRRVDAIDLFDYSAIALSFTLYLVGLYLRRRRLQNVRQLAAIQPGHV